MRTCLSLIVGWVLLVSAATNAAAQSSIELRQSARLTPGVALTLAQVARLDGPEAIALGSVVILEAAKGTPASLTVDDVRRALDGTGRINWGRITLRGSTCTLAPTTPPAAERSLPDPSGGTPDTGPVERGTVQEALVSRIAQLLRCPAADLRLTFTADDRELLRLSTAGRTVEVRPTAVSDRLPLAVTVFEGDRIIAEPKTIRVDIKVRRSVLIALAAKRRGETLAASDFTIEERWLGPTARPAAADQVVGAAAKSRIDAGSVIMADDVAPAVVVSKSDVVTIRCVSGSLALTTRGRALAAGREGEVIEFQAMDSKRTFFARIDGRGRAVIAAGSDGAEQHERVAPPKGDGMEVLR